MLTNSIPKDGNTGVWSAMDSVEGCIKEYENVIHEIKEPTKLDLIYQKLTELVEAVQGQGRSAAPTNRDNSSISAAIPSHDLAEKPAIQAIQSVAFLSSPVHSPPSMNEKEYSAITDSNYLRKPILVQSPYTKRIKSVDESNLAMAGKYSPGLKVDSTLCSEQEMKSLCLCGNTKSAKSTDSVCQKEAIADWLKKQITNLKNHIRANMTNEKSKGDILNPDFVLKMCNESSPDLYYVLSQLYETKKKQRNQNIVVHILHQLLYLQSTHANWFASQLGAYVNRKAPCLTQLLASYGIITTRSKDIVSTDLERRLFNGIKHDSTTLRSPTAIPRPCSQHSSTTAALQVPTIDFSANNDQQSAVSATSSNYMSSPSLSYPTLLPTADETEQQNLLTLTQNGSTIGQSTASTAFQNVFHSPNGLYEQRHENPTNENTTSSSGQSSLLPTASMKSSQSFMMIHGNQ